MFSRIEKCRSICIVTLIAFILASCGRERAPRQTSSMTEDEAFQTVMQDSQQLFSSDPNSSQAQKSDVRLLIEEMVNSGEIKVKSFAGRSAVDASSTSSALGVLDKILEILASGQANNLFTLAKSLVEQANGNGGKLSFDINTLLQILNAALPIVTSVAPQFTQIVQAFITILPVIDSFIKLFKKPTSPTPTPKPTVTPSPTPTPKPTVTPSPTPTPKPTVTPSPTPTPKPTVTPSPTPTPTPTVSGQAVYDNKCAGCHAVGTYDASGSPNLSGKGSKVPSKYTAGVSGHMGITLTAAEITAIQTFLNTH